jgi:D-sedoheptulose 7-phosphate isomerase
MSSSDPASAKGANPVRHLDALCARRPELAACRAEIERAFALLERCFRAGGQILLCGNGGSAADCEHWSGELLKGFERHRPLPKDHGLPPELARVLHQGLAAIPLTGFAGLRTAWANDVEPRSDFAQLAWALGRRGDVLVGISTSGNAANVCLAAQAAKAKGLSVLALTGAKGGQLAPLADVAIRVPETRTCLAQELHLPVYHALCLMLEDALFP